MFYEENLRGAVMGNDNSCFFRILVPIQKHVQTGENICINANRNCGLFSCMHDQMICGHEQMAALCNNHVQYGRLIGILIMLVATQNQINKTTGSSANCT